MPRVRSFPPIADENARILILGSMPGAESLRRRQYYAHPQNQFWRVLADVTGVGHDAPYEARIEGLIRAGIALWDSLRACVRETSLDADIERDSMVPNDFRRFLAAHPRITHVYFNGATSESVFLRLVRPRLTQPLVLERLPSTSPAHAGMTLADKRTLWLAALRRGPG